MTLPLVVAITGATGVIYGVELLRVLKAIGQPTHLILSESAGLNLSIETDVSLEEVRSLADVAYSNKAVGAPVARSRSTSNRTANNCASRANTMCPVTTYRGA